MLNVYKHVMQSYKCYENVNDSVRSQNLGDTGKGTNRNCYRRPGKFHVPKDTPIIDFSYSSTEINLEMCLAQARITVRLRMIDTKLRSKSTERAMHCMFAITQYIVQL